MQMVDVKKEKAAIDNDFLQHLLNIKKCNDVIDLIYRFFDSLQKSVVMNPFVHKHEALIAQNEKLSLLFEREIISLIPFDEIKDDEGTFAFYFTLVKQLYRDFTGSEYPCAENEDSWLCGKSFGEVHTVAMCSMLLIPCFLSDDKEAKQLQTLINERYLSQIEIHNRQECCEMLKGLEATQRKGLKSKELHWISHG